MKKPKPPKSVSDLPIVVLTWIDAQSNLDDEANMADAEGMATFGALAEVQDIGLLVAAKRRNSTTGRFETVLAGARIVPENILRHSTAIPTAWVKSIDVIYQPPNTMMIANGEPPEVKK